MILAFSQVDLGGVGLGDVGPSILTFSRPLFGEAFAWEVLAGGGGARPEDAGGGEDERTCRDSKTGLKLPFWIQFNYT